MTTRADKRGDGYVINGAKHWITGGGVSRLYLVFARVFDEHGVEQGIGGFLAVRDETPGLTIGAREPAMGLRGIPETEIRFEDMEVPADRVVMPPRGFRRGFADLMNVYNSQRVGAAAVALGIADGAYQRALAYVGEREQFGRPLAEFQGMQWMLADMSTQIAAARLMIHKAAASAAPFPDVTLAAQAKIFTSDMAIKVTNDALQCFGARGYSRNLPLETHGAGRQDVHHRRRHRTDSAHGGGVAHPRAKAAADTRRIQPARGERVGEQARRSALPAGVSGALHLRTCQGTQMKTCRNGSSLLLRAAGAVRLLGREPRRPRRPPAAIPRPCRSGRSARSPR